MIMKLPRTAYRYLALAALCIIVFFVVRACSPEPPAAFITGKVTRGDLTAAISATGTVEPEEVIDVGAQVAGRIVSFGRDKNGKTVDYGSEVEAGTVLAQIDDALYSAEVDQARAGYARAGADLEQLKAKLYQAERDWERAQKLGPSDALSQADFDAASSACDAARAAVAVGHAAVGQAQATLRRAEQNLGYCTIKSPVRGVVIDRRVNIGQTVVSSLNAPSLFLLAKDLKRMQVWVSVNEADIGSIYPGQAVSFTLDTYPGEVFTGEVGKIRLNATMTQNVVTYIVEVLTDNSDGRLLPYLTANAQFELSRSTGVLRVPNAALRWFPKAGQVEERYRDIVKNPPSGNGAGRAGSAQKGPQTKTGLLWTPEGGRAKPLEVAMGPSDGTLTEVQGEGLREGLEVITGEAPTASSGGAASSPFAPPPLGGAQKK